MHRGHGPFSTLTPLFNLSRQNEPQSQRQHCEGYDGGGIDPELCRDLDSVGALIEDKEIHAEDRLLISNHLSTRTLRIRRVTISTYGNERRGEIDEGHEGDDPNRRAVVDCV